MTRLIPFNRRSDNLVSSMTSIHDMLDDFFSNNYPATRSLARDTFKLDIEDREKDFLIEAELPGVDKENVSISMEADCLTIAVNVNEEREEEDKERNYVHKEHRFSSMSRKIYLGDADVDNISAKLENGVLSVTVPKMAQVETVKTINIE